MLTKGIPRSVAFWVCLFVTVIVLLSIPWRMLLGVDPFNPAGTIVAALFGLILGAGIAIINAVNRSSMEDKVAERTEELVAANALLKQEMEEHERSEELLRQSQKMEGIGRLAGGVAHDMNNILAAIMSVASTMEMDLKSKERKVEMGDVKDILEACGRGRDLTLSLLGFARKGNYAKKPMSLVVAIGEVENLLKRVIPKTIVIETDIQPDLAQIEGDPSQIKNVLMNLGINAIDAMDSVGTLLFSAKNIVVSENKDGFLAGPYVELTVSDTGSGMDEELVEQIFDPFFTTKPEGKGTGLGLSRVYGSVRDHGGIVTVKSTLGTGTTMTVTIPALDQTEQDPGAFRSAIPVVAGLPTQLLLVDDEPLLRKSGKRLLEHLGYAVTTAQNGAEAVDFFSEHAPMVDLVILDMIMPVMDGEEAFHRLRRIDENIPILICSGYSVEDTAKRLLEKKYVEFVQKPFRPGLLSTKIDDMLSVI